MSILRLVENEPVIKDDYGKWEYVQQFDDHGVPSGFRGYLHSSCDVITDRNGICIACGSPSPSARTERMVA